MATNKSNPRLQIRHNLNGILLADWNWLHPIAITPSGVGYFTELIRAHALKTYFVPALEVDFLKSCRSW